MALELKQRIAEEQVRLAKEQAESEAAARAVSHTQEFKKAEEKVAAAKELADQEAAARKMAEEKEAARKKAEALAEAARADKAGVLCGVYGGLRLLSGSWGRAYLVVCERLCLSLCACA